MFQLLVKNAPKTENYNEIEMSRKITLDHCDG